MLFFLCVGVSVRLALCCGGDTMCCVCVGVCVSVALAIFCVAWVVKSGVLLAMSCIVFRGPLGVSVLSW